MKRTYIPKTNRRFTEEHKQKIASSKFGPKNPNWKGDNRLSMPSLHEWVRNNMTRPEKCQMCDEVPPYDLANITGKYTRDLKNWKWYCRKCHMISDGRLSDLLERDHNTKHDPITGRFISD